MQRCGMEKSGENFQAFLARELYSARGPLPERNSL